MGLQSVKPEQNENQNIPTSPRIRIPQPTSDKKDSTLALRKSCSTHKLNPRQGSLMNLTNISGISVCKAVPIKARIDTFKDRFQIIRALGKGKCADVFLAQDKLTD